MLNPSTADEMVNDPTVERCERRARAAGFGAVTILNLFAYRSTDPKALYTLDDPVGPLNDRVIEVMLEDASLVICGWGQHGKLLDRGAQVLRLIRERGVIPHALKLTRDGQPGHPLYVPYAAQPFRLE